MDSKLGRPPKDPEDRLGSRLYLRLSAEEKERYERAARKASLKLSQWIREALDAAAKGKR
jgi:hypothetical protein